MNIWDFILAYLISQYWGWILLLILICVGIANPGFGVFMLVFIAIMVLIFFLIYQRDNIRAKQFVEAWKSLSDDEKREWEKVRIDKKKNNGGWIHYSGQEAFYLVLKKNFSLVDCFRKQIKKFPEIPRKYYYPAGFSDIDYKDNHVFYFGSDGYPYLTLTMKSIVEKAMREGRRQGENDNLEKEIRKVAFSLKLYEVDNDIIAKATELSMEDVEGLSESDDFDGEDFNLHPTPKSEDDPENLIYYYPNDVPELTETAKGVVDYYRIGEMRLAKKERWDMKREKIASELNRMGVNPNIIQECTGSMGYVYVDD